LEKVFRLPGTKKSRGGGRDDEGLRQKLDRKSETTSRPEASQHRGHPPIGKEGKREKSDLWGNEGKGLALCNVHLIDKVRLGG